MRGGSFAIANPEDEHFFKDRSTRHRHNSAKNSPRETLYRMVGEKFLKGAPRMRIKTKKDFDQQQPIARERHAVRDSVFRIERYWRS